jgi:hypothetical protein
MATTHLHVVHRNPSVKRHVPTAAMRHHVPAVPIPDAATRARNSHIRLGLLAAAAPCLWLLHLVHTFLAAHF